MTDEPVVTIQRTGEFHRPFKHYEVWVDGVLVGKVEGDASTTGVKIPAEMVGNGTWLELRPVLS